MSRLAVKISEEEFIKQIRKTIKDNLTQFDSHYLKHKNIDTLDLRELLEGFFENIYGDGFLSKVHDDWSKVDSSTENYELEIKSTNDFSYIEVWGGGDWEIPMIRIIYWDGKIWRGYIPTKGNIFNRVSMTAFGSEDKDQDIIKGVQKLCPLFKVPKSKNLEDENDLEEVKETAWKLIDDLEIDYSEILKDIESRIKVG